MHKQAQDAPAAAAAAAPDVITRISNWFNSLNDAQKYSLIGGASGAAIGGGALALSQALAPSQQDPATGKRRKKGVLSKAVLGAILGGTAGAGLGYTGIQTGIITPAEPEARRGWLRTALARKYQAPAAGALMGAGVGTAIVNPNMRTRAGADAKLNALLNSTKITPEQHAAARKVLDEGHKPGGIMRWFGSKRFRNMDAAKARDIQSGARPPVIVVSPGRVGKMLSGIRKHKSPSTIVGSAIVGGGVGEVARRTYWKPQLDAMDANTQSRLREAAIQAMENGQ